VVALEGENVVGTAMATPLNEDIATINMVIVNETMRGRGLGRKLMEAALDATQGRNCLLIATQDGLPLYEKLGFVARGEIIQHQGAARQVDAPRDVSWVKNDEFPHIVTLDHQAFGHDRTALMQLLRDKAKFAVIRLDREILAFAAIRPFGRGQVSVLLSLKLMARPRSSSSSCCRSTRISSSVSTPISQPILAAG
jgi:hypothetical protein